MLRRTLGLSVSVHKNELLFSSLTRTVAASYMVKYMSMQIHLNQGYLKRQFCLHRLNFILFQFHTCFPLQIMKIVQALFINYVSCRCPGEKRHQVEKYHLLRMNKIRRIAVNYNNEAIHR